MYEIIAVLASPVIALVVGQWISDGKEKAKRRLQVFQSLWLTRNDMGVMSGRMSPEHVRALNMIEIEFAANGLDRFFGRVEQCDAVMAAWHVLRDAFFVKDFDDPNSPEAQVFFAARDLLLVDLLVEMSRLLGYEFTGEKILNSSYAPKGHTQVEMELGDLRKALLDLAHGKTALHMTDAPPTGAVAPSPVDASPVGALPAGSTKPNGDHDSRSVT